MDKKKATQWNDKETKMLKAMPLNEPVAIYDLAKMCFKSVGTASTKRGNSWVRNSLRKPVKLKIVKQLGRGLYMKMKPENRKAAVSGTKKTTRSKATTSTRKKQPKSSAPSSSTSQPTTEAKAA